MNFGNTFKLGIILSGVLIFSFSFVFSQISEHNEPLSFRTNQTKGKPFHKFQEVQAIEMPPVNMALLNREDSLRDQKGIPYRFGLSIPVNININNSGTWDTLIDGTRVWRLRIHLSKGGKSLSFIYNQFHLPEGTQFHIYSEDKKQVLGAFTSFNNKGKSIKNPAGFATSFVFGRNAVLEYMEPPGTSEKPVISLSEVIHAYRGIKIPEKYAIESSSGYPYFPGTSEACEVNINCLEGAPYQYEKHAVALITLGGFACTGSLVQNTSRDANPYFLTANHCLNNMYDALGKNQISSLVLYWNYESPDCSNTFLPATTTQGGILLANSPLSDFALIKLQEDPSTVPGINPTFLEWNRSSSGSSKAFVIHHPHIDIKKISLDTSTPVKSYPYSLSWYGNNTLENTTLPNTHWALVFDIGEQEGGSSGSALMDENHLLIGQLHGGFAANCIPKAGGSFFGRFDVSWDGDSTAQRSLRPWLDPLGTNPVSSFPVSISGPGSICGKGNYLALGVPTGETVTWSISPNNPNIQLIPNGNSIQVKSLINDSLRINLVASIHGPSVSYPVLIQPNVFTGSYLSDGAHRNLDKINYVAPGDISALFHWTNMDSITLNSSGTGTGFNWDGNDNFGFNLAPGENLKLEFTGISYCTGQPKIHHIAKRFISSLAYSIQVSPNPSNGIMNLNIQTSPDTTGIIMMAQKQATKSSRNLNSLHSTKILVYDLSQGTLVREWVYHEDSSPSYSLNASRLKPGTYVLKMSRDDQTCSINIQIQ